MAKVRWVIYFVAVNVVGCLLPLATIVVPIAFTLKPHRSGPTPGMPFVLNSLPRMMPIVAYTSVIVLLYTALSGKRYSILVCSLLAATAYPIQIVVMMMIWYRRVPYDSVMFGYMLSFGFVIVALWILTPIRRRLHHFR